MLKIYAIPVSLYCAKLRILLRHKGLNWQEVSPPSGYGSEEYKQIVPSGNLPAMVQGDLLLTDSEAIAEYLNETSPSPAMLPDDVALRAKSRALGRFHDTRLEPALRALFGQIKPENRQQDVLSEGGKVISRHLAVLASLRADAGLPKDQLYLCDCGFAITFEWIASFEKHMGLPIVWPDEITKYRKDLAALPAVAREYADYLPKLAAYMKENS